MLIDLYLYFLVAVIVYNLSDKYIPNIKRRKVPSNEHELVLGHDKSLFKKQITLNMREFPSLSIVGVTNSGKSCLIAGALMKNKADKVLLNAYDDDYSNVYFKKRITDIDQIEKYLDYLLEIDRLDHFTIIVIDEALSLTAYKKINDKLKVLLSKNRHKNCFIVLLFQELNKTIVPYKSLIAARLSMRLLQQSDYQSALGISLDGGITLQNREFILVSDSIYKGKSYNLNF